MVSAGNFLHLPLLTKIEFRHKTVRLSAVASMRPTEALGKILTNFADHFYFT